MAKINKILYELHGIDNNVPGYGYCKISELTGNKLLSILQYRNNRQGLKLFML